MNEKEQKMMSKVEKELPEFVDEIRGLTQDQLNTRLANLTKEYCEVELAEDNDEEYQGAKDSASELGAPYRDAKKVLNLKTAYIFNTLKEKNNG
jgi:hypothetical protein